MKLKDIRIQKGFVNHCTPLIPSAFKNPLNNPVGLKKVMNTEATATVDVMVGI